jgi:hypothetical protein
MALKIKFILNFKSTALLGIKYIGERNKNLHLKTSVDISIKINIKKQIITLKLVIF